METKHTADRSSDRAKIANRDKRIADYQEQAQHLKTVNAELLAALEAVTAGDHGVCRFDVLNPCWNNRPNDVAGKHWGVGDACPVCTARALIAKHTPKVPG